MSVTGSASTHFASATFSQPCLFQAPEGEIEHICRCDNDADLHDVAHAKPELQTQNLTASASNNPVIQSIFQEEHTATMNPKIAW